VPLSKTLVGVLREAAVLVALVNIHPGGFAFEHHVGAFRGSGQFGVDGGGEGVNQLRPARIVQPQGAGTVSTKMPFGRAGAAIDAGMVNRDMLFAFHPKSCKQSTQIDRKTAATGSFTADGAITAIERIGVRRI